MSFPVNESLAMSVARDEQTAWHRPPIQPSFEHGYGVMKRIVVVCGEPGTGKTTLCEGMERDYGFTSVRVSALIEAFATERGIALQSRSDYEAAHAAMLEQQGVDCIVNAIVKSDARRVCVDGLRVPLHAAELREYGAQIIGLVCDDATAFARRAARMRSIDTPSMATFGVERLRESAERDPLQVNMPRVMQMVPPANLLDAAPPPDALLATTVQVLGLNDNLTA